MMAVARANRKQSQARTRARIVDVARRLFLEEGSAATLEQIAGAAGFTIGAVYSNFDSKDALLLAVLAEQSGESVASAVMVMAEPGVAMASKLDAFVDAILDHAASEPGWVRLSAEARALATRSAAFRDGMIEIQGRNHAALLDAATEAWRLEGAKPPLPIALLVETSLQLLEGVAARHLLEPDALSRAQLRAALRQLHGFTT